MLGKWGSEDEMRARRVLRVIRRRGTSDGAGVRLRRSIGGPETDHLDPFLLLDESKSDDEDDTLADLSEPRLAAFRAVPLDWRG